MFEECFFEVFELLFKRRVRILECGYYFGLVNVMVEDDEEGELEYLKLIEDNWYWCKECKIEICYEKLGFSKIYWVKVYVSNGFMKFGVWEVCWREMEWVDCEVELIFILVM